MSHFDQVEKSLNQICNECPYHHSEECGKNKCNIGFALNIAKHANANSVVVIDDGDMLIPKNDMKYYKDELIAKSIAEICKLCKECRENHSETCIISICRRSLENTIFKETLSYPGNVLLYLMEVSKQNATMAELIKQSYQQK